MDQHPVAGARRLAVRVEQADVDVAHDPGDVDLREPVRLVDDLEHLPWDREAHQSAPGASAINWSRPDTLPYDFPGHGRETSTAAHPRHRDRSWRRLPA